MIFWIVILVRIIMHLNRLHEKREKETGIFTYCKKAPAEGNFNTCAILVRKKLHVTTNLIENSKKNLLTKHYSHWQRNKQKKLRVRRMGVVIHVVSILLKFSNICPLDMPLFLFSGSPNTMICLQSNNIDIAISLSIFKSISFWAFACEVALSQWR